jgi:hypothetical protein
MRLKARANEREPEHYAKSGDLVIWESRTVIGTGPANDLAKSVADRLKGEVKEFVTLYIKHRKPIE